MLRIVLLVAALSVLLTVWSVAGFARSSSFGALLATGALGIATCSGWTVTLVGGPFAAVQLWRYKNTGRIAGLVLFGSGSAYYILGFFLLRGPEAQTTQIAAAAAVHAVPFLIFASPKARAACETAG